MPELPEVETVMNGLSLQLQGKRLQSVDVRFPKLRFPIPAEALNKLCGHQWDSFARRAKYGCITTSHRKVLVLHLGMSGRLTVVTSPYTPQKHDHVIFHFTDGTQLVLNDPRRFGDIRVFSSMQMASDLFFSHMGIEPLSDSFTGSWLYQHIAGKKTLLKTFLMDQRYIVGVGNIYACEALFEAGLHPSICLERMTKKQCIGLVKAIKNTLKRAIDAGGSSLKDYRQSDGTLGYFQHQWAVYGKAGEICPKCLESQEKPSDNGCIVKEKTSGRSTFFCPNQQKLN